MPQQHRADAEQAGSELPCQRRFPAAAADDGEQDFKIGQHAHRVEYDHAPCKRIDKGHLTVGLRDRRGRGQQTAGDHVVDIRAQHQGQHDVVRELIFFAHEGPRHVLYGAGEHPHAQEREIIPELDRRTDLHAHQHGAAAPDNQRHQSQQKSADHLVAFDEQEGNKQKQVAQQGADRYVNKAAHQSSPPAV